MPIKLVSFVLCPFVQRAVITLKEKRVDFAIEYIDLADPPEWFKEISPLGKVPLLRVDNEVIFESSVIIEYLDEVYAPRLHLEDPLRRAQQRAWIEYGSGLLMDLHGLCIATDEKGYAGKLETLLQNLQRLEKPLSGGLLGGDAPFCLADAAYAPLFMRLNLLADLSGESSLQLTGGLADWSTRLLNRPSVADSVVADFRQRFVDYFAGKDSWLITRVTARR